MSVTLLLTLFLSGCGAESSTANRTNTIDFDGDGIVDSADLDDDNDGIPDTQDSWRSIFTVDIDKPFMAIDYCCYGTRNLSLREFGNIDLLSDDQGTLYYNVLDNTGFSILNSSFSVDGILHESLVNIAVEIQALNSSLQLATTLEGVVLSTNNIGYESIEIIATSNTAVSVASTESNGKISIFKDLLGTGILASNSANTLHFDLDALEDQLVPLGYSRILHNWGDFRITIVIEGIQFDISDHGETNPVGEYSVFVGDREIQGVGIQGYLHSVF